MRYRVLDLPAKGTGAFVPLTFPNPTASSWGLVHVSGSPGTMPIPAPKPESVWAPVPGDLKQYQPSNVAPDVILPSVYVASARNMGPAADAGIGMAARRHTPLPVPATSWRSIPKVAWRSRRTGSRYQIPWPRAFQRFPSVGKASDA